MLNFLYRWLTFHVFLQVAEFFYNDRILGQAGRKIGESVGSISIEGLPLGGRTHSPGGEGDGGSIFWKTREIGLPSYNDLSTRESLSEDNQNILMQH